MRHVNEKKFSPSAEGLKDKNKDKDVDQHMEWQKKCNSV